MRFKALVKNLFVLPQLSKFCKAKCKETENCIVAIRYIYV